MSEPNDPDNLTPTPIFHEGDPARNPERWAIRLERFPARFLDSNTRELPPSALRALRENIPLATNPNATKRQRAMGWVIAGETGTGKTRIATLLALHRAAATWGFPGYLSAVQLRAKAFADWGAADKIMEAAYKPDILVIDDLGKGTPGATIDEIIFAILDNRSASYKPTIITTNYTPGTLRSRFKERETADAIMRRIQEFNNPIIL